MTMDFTVFLPERLDFAAFFFETAASLFRDMQIKIETGVEPYNNPPHDESGEPPYMAEWQDALIGYESVGAATLSLVASSLQLFVNEWVREVERRTGERFEVKHNKGWLHALRKIFKQLGINETDSGADLKLLEQVILARNRGQHPDEISVLSPRHSKSDLTKFPSPYLVSEADRRVIEYDDGEESTRSYHTLLKAAYLAA